MSDLLFQNLSTVQSNQQPMPATIASAATIAPTGLLTVVTGEVVIANIIPPVTGAHLLFLVFTATTPGTATTTGNIATAVVPTQNIPTGFLYNPQTAKYYAWANNLT